MEEVKKNLIPDVWVKVGVLFIFFIIVVSVVLLFIFKNNTITKAEAEEIVRRILLSDSNSDSVVAYLYPEILLPGTVVKAGGQEDKMGVEIKQAILDRQVWFAWIDKDPGNAVFTHPTEFIFINAITGDFGRVQSDYWPIIGDELFKGSSDEMIVTTLP